MARRSLPGHGTGPRARREPPAGALAATGLHAIAAHAPLGELADIMDVGFTCTYLATPFAQRVTGGTIYIDGGANIVA